MRDEDFEEDTRLMRRWLNGETVPADPLAAELRWWADFIVSDRGVGDQLALQPKDANGR